MEVIQANKKNEFQNSLYKLGMKKEFRQNSLNNFKQLNSDKNITPILEHVMDMRECGNMGIMGSFQYVEEQLAKIVYN